MSHSARLVLACVGLHPGRLARLVGRLGSAAAVLDGIRSGRVEVAAGLAAAASVDADEWRSRLESVGAVALFRGDDSYPWTLSELPDPPDVLFVRGRLPASRGVAVVGTRTATVYGLRLASRFGAVLSHAGWPVVSGLARGIDGAAHQGSLEGVAPGVAVLGSGPDVWYPPEHRRLGEQLLESGGAVISEYPPGARPEPWRFPLRNRLISGLAAAVVVVEARPDGGALITARLGLEQGRDVFAVPGDIDRVTSEGCNLLIRDGAHPVLGVDDLLQALSLLGERPVAMTHGKSGNPDVDPLVDLAGPVGRPLDWLAARTGHPVSEVLARVALLELDGLVRLEGDVVAAI